MADAAMSSVRLKAGLSCFVAGRSSQVLARLGEGKHISLNYDKRTPRKLGSLRPAAGRGRMADAIDSNKRFTHAGRQLLTSCSLAVINAASRNTELSCRPSCENMLVASYSIRVLLRMARKDENKDTSYT